MTPQPWFRCYSEILHDRKIERICRETKTPKAYIMGVWNVLLILANDSPVRGALLLTEDIPLTFDDLALETGLDDETLQEMLDQFQRMQMLAKDEDIYYITNWGKRQYASDSSTERVRQWREKQRLASDNSSGETSDDVTEERDGNNDETLQKHSCNLPEAETEAYTETEADISGASACGRGPPSSGGYSETQKEFLGLFGAKRFKNKVQSETIGELDCKYGRAKVIELARWAAKTGMNVGKAVVAVESALKKQAGDGGPQTVRVDI